MGDIEGYIEKEIEETKDEVEPSSLYIVSFRDKSLAEWEVELSLTIPRIPAPPVELSKALASANNKFQIAYNCYNDLLVETKMADITFKKRANIEVGKIVTDLKSKDVKRFPSKENLYEMAIRDSSELEALSERLIIFEAAKDFFDENKKKLAVMIKSISDMLFSANQSDKMFNLSDRTGGL